MQVIQVMGINLAKARWQSLPPGAYWVLAFDYGIDYQNPEVLAPYLDKAASVRVAANQNASVTVELIHTGE
jgi:hypothetical protein